MKNEQLIRNAEKADTATPTRRILSPFLRSAEVQGQHRKIRVALPLPRRRECLTKRALIAAMRAAELAEWESSGGDYLRSGAIHQPVDPRNI